MNEYDYARKALKTALSDFAEHPFYYQKELDSYGCSSQEEEKKILQALKNQVRNIAQRLIEELS